MRYRRQMPSWKHKAMLQRAFSVIPAGHRLNFLFQRHVTHGLPIPDAELLASAHIALHHVDRLAAWSTRDLSTARFFEFGAGPDLHIPLVLWCMGVDEQVVVDIRALARTDLVADVAARLAGAAPSIDLPRVPTPPGTQDLVTYLASLGIDYRAPCDARSTGLPDASVDFVTSTNTLEHIPPEDIVAILHECHRILTPDGLMSFQIDYMDHYSYFDDSISVYNFLTYDDDAWKRYNPSLHYQNRLRHVDHVAIIEDAGFVVVEEFPSPVSAADMDHVRHLPLAPRFTGLEPAALAVRDARLVLAKAPVARTPS